mmetsp:Transcript_152243/g.276961  ORF Transcript_152243/g.276961 Transcript_152243/m.276961 type:complete len:1086 (-) Transcript_152243:49-3306(-)
MQWFSSMGSWSSMGSKPAESAAPGAAEVVASSTQSKFAVGEMVEYYSSSSGTWIMAKVLALNPHGTYNLDCKPDVPLEKIRRPGSEGANAPTSEFAVGEMIEYFSATHGWIPAKVLAKNPRGTYNLDCKPDVVREKIRRPASGFQPPGRGNEAPPSAPMTELPKSSLITSKATGQQASSLAAPIQLIRVSRSGQQRGWQYEVCAEGAAVLERQGARRISVVSTCGPRHIGKSYLLSLLLESGQKQSGSTGASPTEGIWLSGAVDHEDDNSPLVVFLDCEGFGNSNGDRTRDAQLLTLCILLSSVLMLNTSGALNDGTFNALAFTKQFAEHMEERGNESSHPVLLWILRDVLFELRDAGGRSLLPDEYLEQALFGMIPSAGQDQDRGQAARSVRQSLLRFCSRRTCVTLAAPASQESQLQQLHSLPYSSLKSEFRAGVEALRAQLMATAHTHPKTVGGHPLSGLAFVALTRHLVELMNIQKQLNLKTAWESVQHTTCKSLSEKLRGVALVTLHTLTAGEKLAGGAQLPLTDEALRMVLRQQRHELKERWDEESIGEEAVRREYWQELKESFAREERLVTQQNARLADQRLKDALTKWQDWLDDDNAGESPIAVGDLGYIMERMPFSPLSRASRAAIEAATRRLVAARDARRGAAGAAAGASAAVAAGSLGLEAEAKLKQALHAEETSRLELKDKSAELEDARAELQRVLGDVEAARVREQDLRWHQRELAEKEASLRAELEQVRADAAQAQADHLVSERLLKSELEQARSQVPVGLPPERRPNSLEEELELVHDHTAKGGEIEAELEAVRATQAAERRRLEEELERLRAHASSRGDVEGELERNRAAEATERKRLEAELEQVRGQAAERHRIESDLETTRTRHSSERQRLEAELETARAEAAERHRLEAELEQAKQKAEEQRKLQQELEQVRKQAEEYREKLAAQHDSLKSENARTRAEHQRIVEDTKKQLEEERKVHADRLGGERDRLLERERNAGILEGQVHAITSEATSLRDRVAHLQQKVCEVEGQKGQHLQEKDRLQQDLQAAQAKLIETQDEMRCREEEYEKRLEEVGHKGQPKCGCSVQ